MILRPWVILLAAGGSSRFGRAKQLARLGGQTLLRRATRLALAARPDGCIVVLGARAAQLRRELKGLPVRVAMNRRWRAGIAGSLRAGLARLPPSARAALILLADQVAVRAGDLGRLIAAWQRRPQGIVAAQADGVNMPPAIFPRRSFAALRRLRGDAGARRLLADRRRHVISIKMTNAASDVDRPADLSRIRRARSAPRARPRRRKPD